MEKSVFNQEFSDGDWASLTDSLPDTSAWEAAVRDTRRQEIDLMRGDFYPELLRAESSLRHVVAAAYGIAPDCVLANHGSNGSIDSLLTLHAIAASARPKILLADPTYFRVFASCQARRYEVHPIPCTPDYHVDVDQMVAGIEQHSPDVIYLCSPNNPTGIPMTSGDLSKIMRAAVNTSVILDRTLAETSAHADTSEILGEYKDRRLVVLHSFSKYQAMSQYRIGVSLFASSAYAAEARGFGPLGVSLEGCVRAGDAVRRMGGIRPAETVLSRIRHTGEMLREGLKGGYHVTDFAGNYGLIYHESVEAIDSLCRRCEAAHIAIMKGSQFPIPKPNCFRIVTAGTAENVGAFLSLLNQ